MDSQIVRGLEGKFNSLEGDLDDRGRRRRAASVAIALGYGGISAVSQATGLSVHTIRKAIRELESHQQILLRQFVVEFTLL